MYIDIECEQQQPSKQDTNEDICFECRKGGKLYCCSLCVKSFHQNCLGLNQSKLTKQWECTYCSSSRNCQFCHNNASNQSFFCTICLLPSHATCINQYRQISHQIINETLLKSQSYVCIGCLLKYGVRMIKQTYRLYKENNSTISQEIICLAQINYPSPIHFSFYKERDIKQSFEATKQRMKKDKLRNRINNSQLFKYQQNIFSSFSIDKILQIKKPPQYRGLNLQQIFVLLLNKKELSYGRRDNFMFLVKWQNVDYEYCSWQDECLVKIIDNQGIKLQKFLVKEKKTKSMSLAELHIERDIGWNGLVDYQHILKMAWLNTIYQREIIQSYDHSIQKISAYTCYFLNHTYLVDQYTQISIVVVEKDHLTLWQVQFQQNCPYLNVVVLKGSEKSLNVIRQKQLNQSKSKSTVLLTTFQILKQSHQWLDDRLNQMKFIFIEYFPSFPYQFKNVMKLKTNIIFLLRELKYYKNRKDLTYNLCQIYNNKYILKHDLNWSTAEIIPPGNINSPQLQNKAISYCKQYLIDEEQRLSIMRFLLRFGLPVQNHAQLYQLLRRFDPQVFHMPSLNAENAATLKGYINSLLTILLISTEGCFITPQSDYYFSFIEAQSLFKRITNLSKLRKFIREGGVFNLGEGLLRKSNGVEVVFSGWKREEDKILAHLILDFGMDNWSEILEYKQWQKYSSIVGRLNMSFGSHLKMKCIVQFKTAFFNLEQFVKERAEMMFLNL